MGTSPENILTSFDLDLLICSASTSLTETIDHGYQTQNVGTDESTNSYQVQSLETSEPTDYIHQVQNHGISGTTNNYQFKNMNTNQLYQNQMGSYNHVYQTHNLENELSYSIQSEEIIQKSDYDALVSNFQKLSTDFVSLKNDYKSKDKDYDAVKRQYAKLASDYANLHRENNEHAMSSLNITAKYENMEKKEVEYLATIKALTSKCDKYSLDICAQSKQFVQYQSYVEDLQSQISTLKNSVKTEKNNGKDSRKMISTLTSNNKTLKEHLCLFACVIEGRKQLDKESRRFIKKYCKKSNSSKNGTDTESCENQSVDTGRGSSLAYSDGDSFYSPSYNCSPLSAGNVTPRNEATKIKYPITIDVPPSLINFEKGFICSPALQTIDVATNTMICHKDKSSMAKVETISIATSPIAFDEISPVAKIHTMNIGTSPVSFDDPSSIKTLNTSSFILFDNTCVADKAEPKNTATSPVRFNDTNPVAKAITLNTATSPVRFDDTNRTVKAITLNIATSPVQFDDTNLAAKAIKMNKATSPVRFDDTNLVAKKITKNKATSPIRFDDTNLTAKEITSNTATSPVQFDDTNLVAKAITMNTATSPVRFDDTNLVAKAITLNTATSPIQFDDIDLVAKTITMNIATSPVQFDDTNPVAKAITSNTATSPVQFDDMNLVAKTITMNIATSPVRLDETNLTAKSITLNTATSPVQFENTNLTTKAITSNTATSPVRFDDTNLAAKARLLNTATSPIRFLKPITSRNIVQIPVSKKPVTKTACQVFKITEKLKEIVSMQTHSLIDTENDLEIKMILSKHRMNWNMLSPISQSPEAEQNEPTRSEKKEKRNKEEEVKSLAQSLYLSDNDSSDNEIDREESHISHISELPTANPPKEANSDVIFDLIKSQVESDKTERVKSHNTGDINKFKSQEEISNKNRAYPNTCKTRVSSTKGKKLTNLQKIYKANIRKSLINIEDVPPVNRTDLDPKPHSMSPFEHSVPSRNKEKETKWSKRSTDYKPRIKQATIGVCKESQQCSTKELLQLPKEKAKGKSPDPLLFITNVLPKSDKTRQSKCTSDLPSHTNPSESETKAVSNNTSTPAKTNPIIESVSNNCIKTSVIQWNGACSIPHNQVKPSPESVPKKVSISDLPHSKAVQKSQPIKKLCTAKDTQTNDTIVFPHTRTHPLPVACTKKRSVTETHTDTNLPETDEKKTNSQQELSNNPPECGTSIPEVIDDVRYLNPKPIHKRISRVKTDITIKTSIPSTKDMSTINDRLSTSDKLKRTADVANDELDVKRKRKSHSQQNPTNSDTNIDQNTVIDEPLSVSTKETKEQHSEIVNISHADETGSPDDSNMLCLMKSPSDQSRAYADYNDIALFTKSHSPKKYKTAENWTNNILDRMIYKYGSRPCPVKKPNCKNDETVALQIKTGIDKCVKCKSDPDEYTKTSQQLVTELQKLGKQKIVTGMTKYLNDPARKPEFIIGNVKFQKVLTTSTATPTEMALIDVIELLDKSGIVPWDLFLDSLECTLFNLEKGATPGFDVIESVSHLYANICRFQSNVSRMWIFMLNAMYCLTFKAIPIIKNCLDVMPEVLPYSSTYLAPGLAPLIRCLVFLLNYYRCEDPYKRVDAIRRLLKYKYYYNLQDENETTLLFLLKQSIVNLTESKLERDMLELSFLIVAKRKGTKWCHKNLVQKIILPMIKGEIEVSYRAKQFCITTIGHLMKPYNNDMTVHTEEVINMLIHMFNLESQPHEMKEDIIRGLLNLNMHTLSGRINACLLTWNPPSVSSELEEALQMYVSRKNLKSWHQAYKNYYREI